MEQKNIYGFEMIQKKDIAKILRNGRVWIIDLRTPEKYREAHYPAARNFPFAYIDTWKNEIPENISLILYCEHGNQSLLAARKLSSRKGKVYTVTGGYEGIKAGQ